jgi:hypothetical protein
MLIGHDRTAPAALASPSMREPIGLARVTTRQVARGVRSGRGRRAFSLAHVVAN